MRYSAQARLEVERAGLFSGVLPLSALDTGALLGSAGVTPERLLGVLLVALGLLAGLRGEAQAPRSRAQRLGRPECPPLGDPLPEGARSAPGDGACPRPPP